MNYLTILFVFLLSALISPLTAQDQWEKLSIPTQDLPVSLEEEEEAMILERLRDRHKQVRKELQNEFHQLEKVQLDTEKDLFALRDQQEKSLDSQSTSSSQLSQLKRKRKQLLERIGELLMENEIWELSAEGDESEKQELSFSTDEIQVLNEEIRLLDTEIAKQERAIPLHLDEIEDLSEQIEEAAELADQIRSLQESNQEIIGKFE